MMMEETTKTTNDIVVYNDVDPTLIPKDTIRVGTLDEISGSYGRWHKLGCWRVPYRIWSGLTDPSDPDRVWYDLLRMDEILLTNVNSLSGNHKIEFLSHIMDSTNNWAKKYNYNNKSSSVPQPPPSPTSSNIATAGSTAAATAAAKANTTTVKVET